VTYADLFPPIRPLSPDEVDHEAELALINDMDDFAGCWFGPALATRRNDDDAI